MSPDTTIGKPLLYQGQTAQVFTSVGDTRTLRADNQNDPGQKAQAGDILFINNNDGGVTVLQVLENGQSNVILKEEPNKTDSTSFVDKLRSFANTANTMVAAAIETLRNRPEVINASSAEQAIKEILPDSSIRTNQIMAEGGWQPHTAGTSPSDAISTGGTPPPAQFRSVSPLAIGSDAEVPLPNPIDRSDRDGIPVATPPSASAPLPSGTSGKIGQSSLGQWASEISVASQATGIAPEVIGAQMWAESRGRQSTNTVNGDGTHDIGLMQIGQERWTRDIAPPIIHLR